MIETLAKILIAVVRQGSPELAEGLTTNEKSHEIIRQLPFALSLSKGAPSIYARGPIMSNRGKIDFHLYIALCLPPQ
jgi:hypothetical protein